MATFGKTTDGSTNSASSATRVWVSTATPSETGTVTTGHARIWLSASGSASTKFVIYADSSGSPGALLAESDVLSVTATTEGERSFTFSGANTIQVVSGTPYWIGVAWEDPGTPSLTVSRDGTAGGRYEQSFTWPTLPNPYGTPTANNTGPIDAYVTFTVGGGGGTGTVTYRHATADSQGNAGTATATKPTGVTSGDLLLAVQTTDLDGTLGAMTAPSGWTEVGSQFQTGVGGMKVWQKVAGGSEPASYAFPDSTSSNGSVVVAAFYGQHTSTPLAVSPTFAVNGSSTTSHPAPSVTGVAGGMLVTAHLAGTNATSRTYTPPSGMTEIADTALASSGYIATEVNTLTLAAAGATGTKTATPSASTPYVTMSLVIAPASGTNLAQRTGGFLVLL